MHVILLKSKGSKSISSIKIKTKLESIFSFLQRNPSNIRHQRMITSTSLDWSSNLVVGGGYCSLRTAPGERLLAPLLCSWQGE